MNVMNTVDVSPCASKDMKAALRRLAPTPPFAEMGQETGAQWFRQRIASIRRDPEIAPAAAEYARATVRSFERRSSATRAMGNIARQTVCMAILSSYFGQADRTGGAVVSSLQSLTTAMGVCSKNTTAAIVALLERIGLVVRVEDKDDRRWHHIQPTEQLLAVVRDFHRISLATTDTLFPGGNYSLLFERDRDIQERCFAVGLYSFMAVHSSVFDFDESRLFTTTECGGILLLKLLSSKSIDSASDDIVEFRFDEVGSLFGLSRTHVRRLMTKAEAGGFLRLLQDGGRRVQILSPLHDLFENMVAANVAGAQLSLHLAGGERLLAEPRD